MSPSLPAELGLHFLVYTRTQSTIMYFGVLSVSRHAARSAPTCTPPTARLKTRWKGCPEKGASPGRTAPPVPRVYLRGAGCRGADWSVRTVGRQTIAPAQPDHAPPAAIEATGSTPVRCAARRTAHGTWPWAAARAGQRHSPAQGRALAALREEVGCPLCGVVVQLPGHRAVHAPLQCKGVPLAGKRLLQVRRRSQGRGGGGWVPRAQGQGARCRRGTRAAWSPWLPRPAPPCSAPPRTHERTAAPAHPGGVVHVALHVHVSGELAAVVLVGLQWERGRQQRAWASQACQAGTR